MPFDLAELQLLHLKSGKTIGGLDLHYWLDRRLKLSGNTKISSAFTIAGHVHAKGGLGAGSIDGTRIEKLDSGVLRTDTDATFKEKVEMSGLVTVDKLLTENALDARIHFKKLVSGHDLDMIFSNAIPVNGQTAESFLSDFIFDVCIYKYILIWL